MPKKAWTVQDSFPCVQAGFGFLSPGFASHTFNNYASNHIGVKSNRPNSVRIR